MSVQAVAKGVRISPRKAGLIAALVRGRSVADALVILEHTPKKAAAPIQDVILSAKANATHNHGLKEDTLVISELTIGHGVALKRFNPVAFGRAHAYKHRSSHIRVVLEGEKAVAKSPAKTGSKTKPSGAKEKA